MYQKVYNQHFLKFLFMEFMIINYLSKFTLRASVTVMSYRHFIFSRLI